MTKIEWTNETWNPVVGCSPASPGCDHCYAAGVAHRVMQPAHVGLTVKPTGDPVRFNGTIRRLPERLNEPLRWRKPRRVFVGSMTDLFHPDVPYRFVRDVFNVMRSCDGGMDATGTRRPTHTFQVLTKRPQRMAADSQDRKLGYDPDRPPANIWFGTSIESDRYVWRANHLRHTAAAVRFLSLEPLLGPLPSLCLDGIDWVIAGGESGPGARPMHPAWVRDIRDRCQEAGVPFFFKQWGEWAPGSTNGAVRRRPRYVTTDGASHPLDTLGIGALDPVLMGRVGKPAAGRELDGRTWDEYP